VLIGDGYSDSGTATRRQARFGVHCRKPFGDSRGARGARRCGQGAQKGEGRSLGIKGKGVPAPRPMGGRGGTGGEKFTSTLDGRQFDRVADLTIPHDSEQLLPSDWRKFLVARSLLSTGDNQA